MKRFSSLMALVVMLVASISVFAQETTGEILGYVKDPSGAAIPGAKIMAASPNLVGVKSTVTDNKGYYHFANMPPGKYLLTVEASGFTKLQRAGLTLEVGRAPSIDLTLSVGSESTVVNVDTQAPAIDVTSVTTSTNVTQDVLDFVPRGTSYQSVIQFAPAASNEPLMGAPGTTGTGAGSPGSQSNGLSFGYSVAGGADNENSYLVEGQETANLIGGYSHTNVPVDFINTVQVATSGIEAEHGGALGGVVNVIMQKGTPQYHGSVSLQWQSDVLNANATSTLIYNPTATPSTITSNGETITLDQPTESYRPVKAHYNYMQPGFTLGGPLVPFGGMRDKIFFFVGFAPELDRYERHVNYGQTGSAFPTLGNLPFSQNTNTYYTTARIDAQVTKKIRVFGSWLYQLQKQYGQALPAPDSVDGYVNTTVYNDPANFAHSQGFTAPNMTVNTGADITITNHLVSTTRFGYYFENYHDIGFGNTGDGFSFQTSGLTSDGITDANGNALPGALQHGAGYNSQSIIQETFYNSNKAIQLDQTLAFYKSGWAGTHNFKGGYQLNRLSNLLSQAYNVPVVQVFPGETGGYGTSTTAGPANCAALQATDATPDCEGVQGYLIGYDYGAGGSAISYNHSLFIQDSWTVGHGITLDLGVRVEKEYLPGELSGAGVPSHPISFGWGDKVAPRLGGAWDVFQNGKMKLFGAYGQFYDQLKLNLAISSFGGEYWNNCAYGLDNPAASNLSSINFAYNSSKRFCQGLPTNQANFANGTTPAGLTFLENENERAAVATCATCNPFEEAVAPNLKPYEQHEATAGFDYQLSHLLSFEARYDRRRLDHVIEDSSIFNPALGGETFVIVNPGQGVDNTFLNFCNFLYSVGTNPCTSSSGLYPPPQTIPAARSYDGLELRVTKAMANHWYGMASYTYSHFRGNYTGLTSSDQADGGGGRVSPNNNRSFDEPYFSYNAQGGSSSGLLPTDRPNKLKGYGYYEAKYAHKFTSDFGIFGYIYQGSPETSYLQDVGLFAAYDFPVDVFNRGKWANITQNPNTGAVTVGPAYTKRTDRFSQADLNFEEAYKINGRQSIHVQLSAINALNEHAVTAVTEQIDSDSSYINQAQYFSLPGITTPGGALKNLNVESGVPWYATVMSPYNVTSLLNANHGSLGHATAPAGSLGTPQTINAAYGQPNRYQLGRTLRFEVHYTF